jgi:hypothetical protein
LGPEIDVAIFKIISLKKMAILTQKTLCFSRNLLFKKTPNLLPRSCRESPEIVIIALTPEDSALIRQQQASSI